VNVLAPQRRLLHIAKVVITTNVQKRNIEDAFKEFEIIGRKVAARDNEVDLPPTFAEEVFVERELLCIAHG